MRPSRALRDRAILLCAFVLSVSFSLNAQTYTPHSLVFTGTTLDQAALTKVAAVTLGKPMTDSEIQGAMQRIVDTGLFAEIRYTVDDRVLNFIVTPQVASAMLPVIY